MFSGRSAKKSLDHHAPDAPLSTPRRLHPAALLAGSDLGDLAAN
jgi:hypothetical protein